MERQNSDFKISYFSLGDVLVLGLMIAAGLYFIITSALKISDLVFGTMNTFDLLQSILGAIAGYGFLFGAYRFMTKSTFLKAIADSIFVEVLYDRLEPLLADIAETKAGYDILNERIDNLNYNVNDIRKSIELGKTNPSNNLVPVQFAIKSITHQFHYTMLTTITLAMYIFMVYYPQWYVPYMSPLTFVLWWALITSHHDLWEVPKAWYWVAIPLLFIPLYTILFTALYSANAMFGTMYLGLGAYALSYYIWCEHATRGILPFGIGERIHNIKTMLKQAQDTEIKPLPQPQSAVFKPYYIGILMIMFSILIFAVSMVGYMIEHKFLNISWQMIGLDITWQPLYSYVTILLGISLLAAGYVFVVKFRGYR
ncbi:Uncharacterised protein [uncultured archaeon]|nr:Uncharacterised protein [uncultured archaeon]